MSKIQKFGRFLLLTHQGTFALVRLDNLETGWKGALSAFPSPAGTDPKKERHVTAGSVSHDGERVAICDDTKAMSVWKRDGDAGMVLDSTRSLSTRSDLVNFVQTPEPAVIVAGKENSSAQGLDRSQFPEFESGVSSSQLGITFLYGYSGLVMVIFSRQIGRRFEVSLGKGRGKDKCNRR